METRARKKARNKHACSGLIDPGTFPLLLLPEELLQLVLSQLEARDLTVLLKSSKAMAQWMMQNSSGKLELQVPARPGKHGAAPRRLLHWAPPASVKLRVHLCLCPKDHEPQHCLCTARKALEEHAMQTDQCVVRKQKQLSTCTLRSITCTKATGRGMQDQQFMCLTEICLEGLALPYVVPPGLAHTCPNVHTLTLAGCTVSPDNSNGNTQCGSGSKGRASSAANRHVAPGIRHLRMFDTSWPWLSDRQSHSPIDPSTEITNRHSSTTRRICTAAAVQLAPPQLFSGGRVMEGL